VWVSPRLTLLQPLDRISWQGHQRGCFASLLAAWVLADDRRRVK
jgi:membrane associated rhomboid family serine protease